MSTVHGPAPDANCHLLMKVRLTEEIQTHLHPNTSRLKMDNLGRARLLFLGGKYMQLTKQDAHCFGFVVA